jgi:hypothetical protein
MTDELHEEDDLRRLGDCVPELYKVEIDDHNPKAVLLHADWNEYVVRRFPSLKLLVKHLRRIELDCDDAYEISWIVFTELNDKEVTDYE